MARLVGLPTGQRPPDSLICSVNTKGHILCPLCGDQVDKLLYRYHIENERVVIDHIRMQNPGWTLSDGICSRCVDYYHTEIVMRQRILPEIGPHFPVRTPDDFIVLPTPLRMDADPRFTGKGVTICFIDSGFYPHPDLIAHQPRIKQYVDITTGFSCQGPPPAELDNSSWHGMMTTVVCAGDGWLSKGLYKGIAADAELVLVKVQDKNGRITTHHLIAGLDWVARNHETFGIRIVNISVGDDEPIPFALSEVDKLVSLLEQKGIVVVAAAGNSTEAPVKPPANSPSAITVGGLDDENNTEGHQQLYHSAFSTHNDGWCKPELIAPAIWIAAPLLPGSDAQLEATRLYQQWEMTENESQDRLIVTSQLQAGKYIHPHYLHADGTSFAAPIVAAVVAQLLEARPELQPAAIRHLLFGTAKRLSDFPPERQGFGCLRPRRALLNTMQQPAILIPEKSPVLNREKQTISFYLKHISASQISLAGSFNQWEPDVLLLEPGQNGIWKIEIPFLPAGDYAYKFLVDEQQWMEDLHNPCREPDGYNGFNSLFSIN